VAGLAAILSAVVRAQWRDLRSLQSIAGNNFFLFVLLLMQDPRSALFLLVLIGVLVMIPLSADPLRTVPPDRLALWPLSPRRVLTLRVASVPLSPIVWIMAILLIRTGRLRPVLEVAAAAGAVQLIAVASSRFRRRAGQPSTVLGGVPALPGRLGGFIAKDLRQLLCTLDFYLACLLAAVGIGYRLFASAADQAALPILTMLVVMALSTHAQCLFGLDGERGVMRYRLMPLRGWRILLAKDSAWLLAAVPLVTALRPTVGLTAGFAALAVGHHASVRRFVPQQRWRFASGLLFPVGVVQVVALFAAGTAVERISGWYLAGAIGLWAASVVVYGFLWDRDR
jgi:hypothetical protein